MPSSPVAKKSKSAEDLCINVVRMLSADQPSAGKSGHPGAPMGCAPMAHVLYGKVMKFNPKNPKWSNRDRFILSNGHACALQYSMLHLTGYDVALDDLKNFRQLGSKCPGHPENFATPGIEVSTGPLGQGIANAVGIAIAEKHLAAEFNRKGYSIVDNYTYVICGDGCLQEGVSSEASSLAGHLGLGKLIVLYDDNKITIDGSTNLSFTENVLQRYEAYGWHVQEVHDGNYNHKGIYEAVMNAKKETSRPSLIKISTIIGLGSAKQNTYSVHGAPLTAEDLIKSKAFYGLPADSFYVPEEAYSFYNKTTSGKQWEDEWQALFKNYSTEYPTEAQEFTRRLKGELPLNWKKNLPEFKPEDKALATRQSSRMVLNKIAESLPELIGGSADLTSSNLTDLANTTDFQKETPKGRYFRFGVREHAMASICNGMFSYGGVRPFCATFLNFLGYALGGIRLSALSRFGVIYIATHDSIFLGEDGPTHQPIEMAASLRSMPQMYYFRPADGKEVNGSYIWAIENSNRPSVLALTRQAVPTLKGTNSEKVSKGAYVVEEIGSTSTSKKLDLIIVASGSEVSLVIDGAKLLKGKYVRIVSMPCMDLFKEQTEAYLKDVFPSGVPVLSVEASSSFGWFEFSHAQIGIDRFGASAPIKDLATKFGFTPENVAKQADNLINFYKGKSIPWLMDRPSLVKDTESSKSH